VLPAENAAKDRQDRQRQPGSDKERRYADIVVVFLVGRCHRLFPLRPFRG